MSIRKKIVWLPYDMDTAIGINNEGLLVFGYNLEDTDQIDGRDVYDGLAQRSVIWNNIRDAFSKELAEMYRTLRSQGKLSYETINKAFQDHQAKWPEALFNEDSQFCYIEPLINDGTNYLEMLQGSKEEQRKWWLYNRFRYMDSKFNAGYALSDFITVRSYAKSDITITPYADIYPTVKFGSYLVQARGQRNVATVLECPVDALNDTETYIYSASQLASVGDLSGLKVGFADFSMATKLQSLKLGDSSSSYTNANLKTLTLGNNVLLQTIDVRNCTALGSGDMKVVDISGCTGIRKAWFTGTQITSLTLPIGGVLDELALPATITNLTVRNQPRLTTFSMTGDDYSTVQTCRVENTDYFLKNQTWLNKITSPQASGGLKDGCRLRLVGLDIDWLADTDAISAFYDKLSRLRGLDINGENLDNAYIEGVIHINSATGSAIAELKARYPYMEIDALHTESKLYYYNGDTLYYTETVLDGGNGVYAGTPTKANSSDGHYSYTFAGWSRENDDTVDADARTAVTADRNVYACYTANVRTYTVTWKNGTTTLETDSNVPWGTVPHYDGSTPTKDGQTSIGWLPDPTQPITGNTTFTAQYLPVYTVTFKNDTGSTTLDTQNVVQGQTATYGGSTPTSSEDASLAFLGWATTANAHQANAVLTNVQSNMTVYAAFEAGVEVAEITDSWDTIMSRVNAGTAADYYNVGNYKELDLGTEGTVNMQIVGTMTDELYSGSGYAQLSWLSMELLATSHRMNPDIQYNTKSAPSWTASGNTWTSQNRYTVSTAKATWTITATEAGTLSIFYKTSNSNSGRNRITTLTVNGTAVATNYTNTTGTTETVEVAAGDTVTVYCEFDLLSASYSYYGTVTFSSTGAFTVSADIQNADTRDTSSLVEGTGTVGGYGYPCDMKTYIDETVYPLIPAVVRSNIKAVKKYTRIYNASNQAVNNVVTSELAWIPSYREIFGGTSNESQGPAYTVVYPDAASRIKMKTGATSASNWWLRSASNTISFNYVSTSGNNTTSYAINSYGVALGFST